ncbi:MAG: carbon-nitrogen hydrolase family protein [PVC group bacterium]
MKKKIIHCAVIQMNSGDDREENLRQAETLVGEAADAGAQIVALPENFARMPDPQGPPPDGESREGPIVAWARRTAKKDKIYLLAGSFPERSRTPGKAYNTSVLLSPEGAVLAAYRKIHLFDVTLPGGESHRESRRVIAGEEAVAAETPLGRMGMTICYDLRFGYLYRRLAELGALLVFVPAAFTEQTGEAHWEVLIRSRAIENQVFIAAPAQQGLHPGGRRTYGHSLIVDPWGTILAEITKGDGIALAALDLDYQAQVRKAMSCRDHRVNQIYQ